MRLKEGVSLKGLVPQMTVAMMVVRDAFAEYDADVVLTSCNDGKHGTNSLHYRDGLCRAMDVRSKVLLDETTKLEVLKRLQSDLGDEFDVLLENLGGENEHYHIEWDV